MSHVAVHAAAFVGFAAVVVLGGRLLAGLLPDLGRWRSLAGVCLGLAWWVAGLFALAACGVLNGWGLAVLALAPAAAAVRRRGPAVRLRVGWRWFDAVAGAVLAVVLAGHFLLALSPQVLFDADVYHLTLPRLYVEHGGFRSVPMSVYSNWPLGAELLYAAALVAGDYVLAKTLHFGFGLLVVWALFVACRAEPVPAPRSQAWLATAWLAAAFFLANDVVVFELRRAYVDLAHAFFFTAAFLFMHRALEDDGPRDRVFLSLAGICCGLAAGVKVTGIAAVAVVGALALPRLARAVRGGRLGRELRPFVLRFAAPAAALWTPWLAKAWWVTGNPIYPFLHDRLGGPDWSSALSARLAAWQSSIGMGREAVDYLLLPWRVILEGGRGYERFDGEVGAFWIVVLPLALVFGWRRALARRALAAAGVGFALWAASSQQMRFLVPVLPLLAIAGAVAVGELVERLPAAGRRAGTAAALGVAAVLVVAAHAPWTAGGYRNLRAFLAFEGDLAASAVPGHHRFVNESLPRDARILFLNTNLGFFCRREYLADTFFEASQIADWLAGAATAAEVRRRLDERGVTHLLVDRRPRVAWPPGVPRLLDDPSQVEELYRSQDGLFVVLRLR